MESQRLNPVIRYLRHVTRSRCAADQTDGHLLERFAVGRDEAAFADLLHRYGPMVLGLCRRVLGNAHDAEDAFQATFLVLARKAGAIRRPHLLGNWLYGVAYRTALKARIAAVRRRQVELRAALRPTTALAPERMEYDIGPILDEEVNRLSEKYRAVFVLCHLEGKTNEEAARQLGCPVGTVLSRLSRARERLRNRLIRRGVTLAAGWLAAELAPPAFTAPVPLALANATGQAGAAFASASVFTTTPSIALAEGVLQTMFLNKLKMAVIVFLFLGIVATTAGLSFFRAEAEEPADPRPAVGPKEVDNAAAKDEAELKILELKKVRLDAAQKECDARIQEFEAGRGTLEFTIGACRRLLEAQLDMSNRKKDKLEALKAHLDCMRKMEEISKERYDNSRIALQEYSRFIFERADAEIQYERAKAKWADAGS